MRRCVGEEIDRSLDAFFEQRDQGEKIRRVPNAFGNKAMKRFLLEAAIDASNDVVQTYVLEAGNTLCAVVIGLNYAKKFSGFANSISHPLAKYSPGRLLEHDLLQKLHGEGIREVDFGLGEDAYKQEWSDPVDLSDALLGVTLKGRVVAAFLKCEARVKRTLKRHRSVRKLSNRWKTWRADS